MDYLMYLKTFLIWFDHFLDPWAEICQIFWCFFLENLKNQKDILKSSDLYQVPGIPSYYGICTGYALDIVSSHISRLS